MIDAYEDEDSIDARLQSRFDRAMASTPIRGDEENDDSIDSDRTRRASFSRSPSSMEKSVTNRLFYDADRQRRTKMKMKLAMEQSESPRRPKISSYAKSIAREKGDIGTRLYEAGRKQRERKMEARRRRSSVDFTPILSTTSKIEISKDRRSKLGEDLYRRARASQLEKQRKIELAESEAKDNARPKLNKRSMRIASQSVRSGRRGGGAFDRLSAPPRRTLDIDTDSDLTFKPRIDAKSKSLSQRRDGGLSGTRRLERLFADESRVRKKVEKMRVRLEEKKLAECTFEPKFLNKSRHTIKTRSMLDRQAEWTKKRDDKIKRLREKRSVVYDEECTFTPKVVKCRSTKKQSSSSPTREVEGVTESIVFRIHDMLSIPQAEEQLMFALRSCDETRTGLVTSEAFLRCVRSQRVYMSLDHEVVLVELLKEEDSSAEEEWISYIDLKTNINTLKDKLKEKQTQNLKDVETLHPGIDRFLKRQQRARELQKQRREIPHCDGTSWTGKCTKPRAPKLHESKRRFKMKLSSSSYIMKSNKKKTRQRYARDVERILKRGESRKKSASSSSSDRILEHAAEKSMIEEDEEKQPAVVKNRTPKTEKITSKKSTDDRIERWARRVFDIDSRRKNSVDDDDHTKEESKIEGMFTKVKESEANVEEKERGGGRKSFYPKSSTRKAETDFDRRLREIRESMQ